MPEKSFDDRLEEAQKKFHKNTSKEDPNVNAGARAGIELIGATLGGGLLGYGIDHLLDTSPGFFISFLIMGVITGFYNIYKITQNLGTSVGARELQNSEKDAKNTPDK